MRSTSIRILGLVLLSALATLACAASPSGSAVASPGPALMPEAAARVTRAAVAGRVRIEVRFRTPTSGTFAMTGAVSDAGSFRASRRIEGGRLQLMETLVGKQGTIRIRALQPCAVGLGTWQVLSGSAAYREMSGRGSGRGGPRCTTTSYPVVAIYTGTVRTPPPPPLAQPGRFGGGTSQREEVVFEVQSGGRSLAAFRLRLTVRCSPTLSIGGPISLPGPHTIAEDRSFAFQSVTQGGITYDVAGRFTSSTMAAGTLSLSGTLTDTIANTRIPCAGQVSWTASLPPPSALPGRYCGFTLQGPGICLDVAPSGREVTGFESAVVVRCFPGGVPPSEFEIALTFSGSIPIGGHVGFSRAGIAVEGLVSGTASIGGLFEPTGTASGGVGVGPVVLDFEGTRYRCHPATGKWEAKRQA